MKHALTLPDGTDMTIAAIDGRITLSRTLHRSRITFEFCTAGARVIADALHDAADHVEESDGLG